MTISTTANRISYSGNGSTIQFSFPYAYIVNTDLKVYVNNVLQILNIDYTVFDPDITLNGAYITFTIAPSSISTIIIYCDTDLLQQTDLPTNGPFPSQAVESMSDKLTLIVQRLKDLALRSFHLGDGDSSNASTILPTPTQSTIWGWDSAIPPNPKNYSPSEFAALVLIDGSQFNPVATFAALSTIPATVGKIVTVASYSGGSTGGDDYIGIAGTVSTKNGRQIQSATPNIFWLARDEIYINDATGAVIRTIRSKLTDIASRSDYDSDAHFTADIGNKPNIDSSDNFNAKVTPTGDTSQETLANSIGHTGDAGRSTINYRTATSGTASGSILVDSPKYLTMTGFRFKGKWSKPRAPVFANPDNGPSIILTGSGRLDITPPASNLGCETTSHLNQWYAVFACANAGDSVVTYKIMPFFRAKSIAGSVITLNFAGNDLPGGLGGYTPVGAYYDNAPPGVAGIPDHPGYNFTAVNNLANCDVLVISETNNGRNNFWSGRTTTVASNTNTTITLNSIGGMGIVDGDTTFNGDWFLVAPPGFTYYKYLSTFLFEPGGSGYSGPGYTSGIVSSGNLGGGDVRNISDSGIMVKSRMGNLIDPNFHATGSVALPGDHIRMAGNIPPLATSVVFMEVATFATASTGTHLATIYSDGVHDLAQFLYLKSTASTEGCQEDNIIIPFGFTQELYITQTGSLDASRSGGKIQIRGWIEP